MSVMVLGAMVLATTMGSRDFYENPRYVSANGEMVVVVRRYERLGDFERKTAEELNRRDPVDDWLDEVPLPEPETVPAPAPEPPGYGAALYRTWPSGYRELLAEFRVPSDNREVLVTNDGYVVTRADVPCSATEPLLTIHRSDGTVVRTLGARDVLTANDQQWLCRGEPGEVRLSIGDTLRLEMPKHTIDIDLETGRAPAPDRDLYPSPVRITAKPFDERPRTFRDPDIVVVDSHTLLGRAVLQVPPVYPDIAVKARITGRVAVQVIVGVDGNVESATIIKPLPFGMDRAVQDAIVRWKFAPDATRITGVIAFEFEIVRHFRLR